MKPLIQKNYFENERAENDNSIIAKLGCLDDICDALSAINPVINPVIFSMNKEKTLAEGYSNVIDGKSLEYIDFQIPEEAAPLDAELLNKMMPYEFYCIEIAKRATAVTQVDPFKYYYDRLRFFNYIIEKENIDLLFLTWLPHLGCDYILYALCKAKNIPTIFFCSIPFDTEKRKSYYYVASSIEYPMTELNRECKKEDVIDLSFYQSQFSGEKLPTPIGKKAVFSDRIKVIRYYLKEMGVTGAGIRVYLRKIYNVFCKNHACRKGKKYYKRNACFPDLNSKFIFFALHFQPEATTLPMGGRYVEQLLAIKQLSYHLPENTFLYVKEHPIKGFWRNASYYKEITRLKNVILIDKKCSSLELIRSAKAVATVTGTVGWEALFNMKPVFMFGHYFYQHAPGVFAIRNNAQCKDAMRKVFTNSYDLDMNKLTLFLNKVGRCVFENFYAVGEKKKFNSIIETHIRKVYDLH